MCVVSSCNGKPLDLYSLSGLNGLVLASSWALYSFLYSVIAQAWSPLPNIPHGLCGQRWWLNEYKN